mmetsp:Transcript_7126/g.20684  ORF Transcript_7126/g.20684 Transcript_7126/m.20684 type:complete len:334 (+) Transcript_7126:354-1355(+)
MHHRVKLVFSFSKPFCELRTERSWCFVPYVRATLVSPYEQSPLLSMSFPFMDRLGSYRHGRVSPTAIFQCSAVFLVVIVFEGNLLTEHYVLSEQVHQVSFFGTYRGPHGRFLAVSRCEIDSLDPYPRYPLSGPVISDGKPFLGPYRSGLVRERIDLVAASLDDKCRKVIDADADELGLWGLVLAFGRGKSGSTLQQHGVKVVGPQEAVALNPVVVGTADHVSRNKSHAGNPQIVPFFPIARIKGGTLVAGLGVVTVFPQHRFGVGVGIGAVAVPRMEPANGSRRTPRQHTVPLHGVSKVRNEAEVPPPIHGKERVASPYDNHVGPLDFRDTIF